MNAGSRIATPVTWPTSSASTPFTKCRVKEGESGWGIKVSWFRCTSHQEQA